MRPRRTALALAAAGLALLAAGCHSNNADGRLVGKWQVVSSSVAVPGVTMTYEFKADGTFAMSAAGPGGTKTFSGKYHPKWGDTVMFDSFNEPISGNPSSRRTSPSRAIR
jgi:hypothetical protein